MYSNILCVECRLVYVQGLAVLKDAYLLIRCVKKYGAD